MTRHPRISPDAVIHPGCRIVGDKTSIGPGCELGAEAPVTLKNCQLGRNVQLKGGYFEEAVFLDGANLGSGAHVRAGTLLEEEGNGAHTVGLKQTILFPFVTLGSLINFCDILMAGGAHRKNHSEVGSSYIHFNFTPHQDKATASLVGDVPRGVLLGENPIFLGGQGGLVGPARIAYGSVIAAGGICRKDVLQENQLYVPATLAEKSVPFEMGVYGQGKRIVCNNLIYIGNIKALKAWYQTVRVLFIRDEFDQAVFDGALGNLDLILAERITRLEQVAGKIEMGPGFWETLRVRLMAPTQAASGAAWVKAIAGADQAGYLSAIQALEAGDRADATAWLQCVVDEAASIGL